MNKFKIGDLVSVEGYFIITTITQRKDYTHYELESTPTDTNYAHIFVTEERLVKAPTPENLKTLETPTNK
jgi:hypothetical protein